MKTAVVLMLFAACAFAQDQAAITTAEAGCGPKDVRFDAKEDATQHLVPQPESGKALIFVAQSSGRCNAKVAR